MAIFAIRETFVTRESYLTLIRFSQVVDVLRNEEPVYLRYVDGWNLASITTSLEPVGEGESP